MENLQGGTLALEHHYHLDQRLTSFGLVTVYAATQDPFEVPVRVTVYDRLIDAGADAAIADRIKASAKYATSLERPGLLTVVDFGEIEQGVPFVIEETIPGPSLAAHMESTDVFAPGAVADLIDRLASLLQSAHDSNVCHGGLKPEWILFPDDDSSLDQARLAHFGLGPSMQELVAMPQVVLTTDLVDCFPPECFDVATRDEAQQQDASQDSSPASHPHLTPAADQWALAALAYRLLVGVHPFFDDPVDASEGILRIKTEEPESLAEMGIDSDIADIIERALAHDPEERWPSVDAFARALRHAIDGPPTTTESSSTESPSPDKTPKDTTSVDDSAAIAAPEVSGEPPAPQPSGYLLTLALLALVFTNLGWFFVTMDDTPEPEQAVADDLVADEPERPGVLPSGLQIQTTPSDAELFVIDDETERSLGYTPHDITDALVEASGLRMQLRHPDFHDQYLTIEDTETGQNFVVDLIAAPDE